MRETRPSSARPASQQGMRRQNLALTLATVAAHGPLSRAEVAVRTGLTRPAVSSLVDQLIGDGLLVEQDTAPSGRVGRPGRALTVSDHGPAGLGLAVGVTELAACVADLRGEVRVAEFARIADPERRPDRVLGQLSALAEQTTAAAAALGLRPVGAVLAVPGVLADRPGTVAHAPNLNWHDVPLTDLWRGPLAPELDNEANLGALAELWTPPARHVDFVHVSAEAGIGGALVVDGRLYRGARGYAGELGHIPVHPEGPACPCGARGCLEQYAGMPAVLRAAGVPSGAADPVTALADRARAADPEVVAALDRAGAALGLALTATVNLVDPAAVVLGGAYAELADWLLPALRRELTARLTLRPWDTGAVTASALGRRGPVVGAALVTVRRIIDDPGVLADQTEASG